MVENGPALVDSDKSGIVIFAVLCLICSISVPMKLIFSRLAKWTYLMSFFCLFQAFAVVSYVFIVVICISGKVSDWLTLFLWLQLLTSLTSFGVTFTTMQIYGIFSVIDSRKLLSKENIHKINIGLSILVALVCAPTLRNIIDRLTNNSSVMTYDSLSLLGTEILIGFKGFTLFLDFNLMIYIFYLIYDLKSKKIQERTELEEYISHCNSVLISIIMIVILLAIDINALVFSILFWQIMRSPPNNTDLTLALQNIAVWAFMCGLQLTIANHFYQYMKSSSRLGTAIIDGARTISMTQILNGSQSSALNLSDSRPREPATPAEARNNFLQALSNSHILEGGFLSHARRDRNRNSESRTVADQQARHNRQRKEKEMSKTVQNSSEIDHSDSDD